MFSKSLVILTIVATFFLTASALTQGEFIVYEEEPKDVKQAKEDSKTEDYEVVQESDADYVEEKKESSKKESAQRIEETQDFQEAISLQDFLRETKGAAQFRVRDIKTIAKGTDNEAPEIDKENKKIALAEVNRKAIESNAIDVIVWVKKDYSYKHVMRSLRNFKVKHVFDEFNGFSGTARKDALERLKKDKRVDYIAFDAPVRASLEESVPMIRADLVAANYNLRGEGIGVCHLDSGINYNIPELAGAYAGGYDFVNNDSDPFDDNGHGTVTAGVIVSSDPTNKGVAPASRLYVAKVLDAGGFGFSSHVTAGINWCIANKEAFNLSVISMSLATFETYDRLNSPGYSDVALQAAYNANIPVVACAGNMGNTTGVAYPAVSPYVIPVTGVYDSNMPLFQFGLNNFTCTDHATSPDMVPCFANRADFVELAAPASVITTTSWFGGAMDVSGTSVASPHVASTIALMKQRNPEMTVEQIKTILVNTGVPVYDPATSLTFSRIDALSAVESVPYLTTVGTLFPGNTINLEISDPQNAGQLYFAVLGFGNDVGIPLSNGLRLPINPDGLFTYSLSPNPLISNNIGFLDANGTATATVQIPPIPGIENYTLYAGFATARTDLGAFLSVSNSETL